MKPSFLYATLLIFILCSCQSARQRVHDSSVVQKDLQINLDLNQINDEALFFGEIIRPAKVEAHEIGYMLYDPDRQEIVSEHQSQQGLIPSSTAKILTTFAALEVLGPQYRFQTSVSYKGLRQGGVLKGDLYLHGSGDPLLKTADLMKLIQSLHQEGIQEVQGRFVYDESFLPSEEMIDQARDFTATYNSALSALSVEFNLGRIFPHTDSPAGVAPIPPMPWTQFQRVDPAQNGLQNLSYQKNGLGEGELWLLSQDFNVGKKFSFPVRDAGKYTAHLFHYLGQMSGLKLPLPQPGERPSRLSRTYTHWGLPLLQIVELNLEYSNNLISELLLLASAKKLSGKKQNLPEAAATLVQWLERRVKTSTLKGFSSPQRFEGNLVLVNGSGLGVDHRISAEQMVRILASAEKGPSSRSSPIHFSALLPIVGVKGTLMDKLNHPDLIFRVWAKTGSQAYSNGLAGFLYTQKGKKLIFAFLSTNLQKRREWDLLVDRQTPKETQEAMLWGNSIQKVQENLLRFWVQKY